LSVPPHQQAFTMHSYCPSECITKALAANNLPNITILASMGHAHKSGTGFSIRIVRNGTELSPIVRNQYWNYQFQDYIWSDNIIPIQAGALLIGDCTYNTLTRNHTTHFDINTEEEMCLSMNIYYPRLSKSPQFRCMYANFTSRQREVLFCNGAQHHNFTIPAFTAYQPKPCVYQPPPINKSPNGLDPNSFDLNWYRRSAMLDQNYQLFWNVDLIQRIIHFAAVVKATGWVGLGISVNGDMRESDVTIGWSYNNTGHVVDAYASETRRPELDEFQDVFNTMVMEFDLPSPSETQSNSKSLSIWLLGFSVLTFLVVIGVWYRRQRRTLSSGHSLIPTEDVDARVPR